MGMLQQLYEVEVEEAKCVARRIGEREELCKLMDGERPPTNKPSGAFPGWLGARATCMELQGFSVRKV